METKRGLLMKNIGQIVRYVIVALLVGASMNFLHTCKLEKLEEKIRTAREQTQELITVQDEKIGEYTYNIGVLEDNLKKALDLSDDQKEAIKVLQKDLNAKIDQIALLKVAIDSVESSGVADIIEIVDMGKIQYKINEHKDGYKLSVVLDHPTGDYTYVIKQDPLTMEIFLAKEKKTGYRVGSIRFPNNPGVVVTQWEILYDPDTRPWYTKFWEDMHLDVGAFGGNTVGLTTMVGYKKVMVGPVFTEEGMNLGFVYRVK